MYSPYLNGVVGWTQLVWSVTTNPMCQLPDATLQSPFFGISQPCFSFNDVTQVSNGKYPLEFGAKLKHNDRAMGYGIFGPKVTRNRHTSIQIVV